MFAMIPFRGQRQGVQTFHPVVGAVQELSAPAQTFGEGMKGPSGRTVRAVTGNSGVRRLSDGGSLSRLRRCLCFFFSVALVGCDRGSSTRARGGSEGFSLANRYWEPSDML